MAAYLIDAFEFVRQPGREAQGSVALQQMSRLVEGLPEQDSDVSWHAQSARGPLGEPLIRFTIDADVMLECQRCLKNFKLPVHSDAVLHIVRTEAQLNVDDVVRDDDEDDDADADLPERVLGSPRFNLLEQVEDELILCVPYVPRHEVCPDPLMAPASVTGASGADGTSGRNGATAAGDAPGATGAGGQEVNDADEVAGDAADGAEGKRPSPFAVLAQLKTRKS
jgi:uncharacterized protein